LGKDSGVWVGRKELRAEDKIYALHRWKNLNRRSLTPKRSNEKKTSTRAN